MPSGELRNQVLPASKRIVVKLGTQLLTRPDGEGLDHGYIADMAAQIAALIAQGREVTLVSSGAIGAGCAALGMSERPTDLAEQQAVAAIGQRSLMTTLHEAFAPHQLEVGQLLLTQSDLDHRGRFLNIRNCIAELRKKNAIAIINENDSVSIDELRVGDNDMLAAKTCHALEANTLVLLTVVDGLLDENNQVIDHVEDIASTMNLARASKSRWGTGGIMTKLQAARLVMDSGESAVIANGRTPNVLSSIFAGEQVGTLFVPGDRKLDSRQRWFGLTVRPNGKLTINQGAVEALQHAGRSLLAVGITSMTGRFQSGDVLQVIDEAGHEIARGLCNYDASELRLIMGKRSEEFETILGQRAHDTVIHRDNLLLKT